MKTKPVTGTCLLLLTIAPAAFAQQDPGTVLWTYDAANLIRSSPAVAPDGTIYFGAEGYLYAITNRGSNKWVFPTPGGQDSTPSVALDGTVYYANGYVYAIAPDGKEKWRYPGAASGCPAIGLDGTVYTQGPYFLNAISPTGGLEWQRPYGDDYVYDSVVIGADGTLYIPLVGGRIFFALKPSGSVSWSYEVLYPPGDSAAIGSDGTLYFTGGPLHAFTPLGTNLWTSRTNYFAHSCAAIGQDGTIYIPTFGGSLCAFTPQGALKWQALTNGYSPAMTPAIDSSGMLYYPAYSVLYAITPAGAVQWALQMIPDPGDIFNSSRTSPAIGPDGTIYVTSANRLYAVAGTNKLADSPWPMYRQNARHTGKVEKPALKQPQKRRDANFEFQLYSQLGQTNTVEGTTDLSNWTALTSLVITSVPMDVVDLNASNYPARFYRASAPP